jgi:hypothetical protein
MQGAATVKVKLRSTYGKDSAIRTFNVDMVNACPSEQKINAETEAEAQGLFGEAVSISGSRAAVLSSGLNAYGLSNVGGVRIYESINGIWSYVTTVVPPAGELQNDVKPVSVLLSGNNLFLGNAAINGQAGRLWLFQRDSLGNWVRTQMIDGTASSKFGTSLAFDGTHLFVGAPSVSGAGAVLIYSLNGSTLNFVSSISGSEALSDFGASLAVEGTRLVIGAPGNAVNTSTTGTFSICSLETISVPICSRWDLANGILGGETIPMSSKLGSSVALKGNLLLVAARSWFPATLTTAPALRNGLVAVIDLGAAPPVVQIIKGGNEELYGSALAFSDTSFFVGVKEGLGKRGYVDQMSLPGSGTANATLRFRYYATDQAPQDRFGAALGVSGTSLIVGAPLDQEAGFSTSGSSTLFTILNP